MSKKILCLFTFPYSIFGRNYLPMMPIVSILTDFVAAMLLISGAAAPEELSETLGTPVAFVDTDGAALCDALLGMPC